MKITKKEEIIEGLVRGAFSAGLISGFSSNGKNIRQLEKELQDFIIKYEFYIDDLSLNYSNPKKETLEEKILKLKTRLADLEICYDGRKKDKYSAELRNQIEDLKRNVKGLQSMEKVTDMQKFKDLYDGLGVEYTFNGNCIWLRQNEKNIIGNDNCKSVIYFDRKGRFVQQGFFE